MKYFYCLIFLLQICFAQAQVQILEDQNPEFNVGVLYDREFVIQGGIHSNGFFVGFMKSEIKTYYKTTFYHFDLGVLKHTREIGSNGGASTNNIGFGSFIYGKRNVAMVLRGGYGMKRFFSEKAVHRGVAVGITIEGGPSLGLLKPYYLEYNFFDPDLGTNEIQTIAYSEETKDAFLDLKSIRNNASFFKGLDEIKIVPGVHLKASAHFDWGAFDSFVKAIDVGIMADVFFKKLDILVPETDDNQAVYVNFFVEFQLGKRW